jgi:hypothetical protein
MGDEGGGYRGEVRIAEARELQSAAVRFERGGLVMQVLLLDCQIVVAHREQVQIHRRTATTHTQRNSTHDGCHR